MTDSGDVCVLIPTLNEAETIGDVVDSFRAHGYENVLVVDGRSTDDTQAIAAEHGARVIEQSGSGKGQAIREGLQHVDASYVLMADGDGTYRPADADRMLEPIRNGRAEHVIGDRFADMEPDAMSGLNRTGNRAINWAFRVIHGRDFADILSGYRAFTLASMRKVSIDADGFGVETELAVECVKHDVPTAVVPIEYRARPGGSETNLHPLRDGGVIFLTLYKLAKTNNPLFYFGSISLVSLLFGSAVGVYVGVEWVTRNVSHEVLAVVSAFAILFSVQLLMFGVLSDTIVTLHREQMNRLESITQRDGPAHGRSRNVVPAESDSDGTENATVEADDGN